MPLPHSFCFSMTYNITLFSRVTINIHLHHWLYCLLSAFGVNILETRTQFGKDITEDIGDFVMGWLYGMAAGGISQGLSYSDWTHCIWLTQPPPRLVRRTSSLESIISITSDPDYGLKSEEARSARTMRGVRIDEERSDELTTPPQAAKIIPTLFAIRFAHCRWRRKRNPLFLEGRRLNGPSLLYRF